MPDPFFASSSRKRKRSTSAPSKGAPKKKAVFNNGKSKLKPSTSTPSRIKKRVVDEELSDATDEDAGGVDDMDLRASDEEPYHSDSENEDETPAEKRLRLAQAYLEGVKNSLGTSLNVLLNLVLTPAAGDGDFDAAEIDKELISARLKQDVMEHAGKVHLFVADKVDS